MPIEQFQRYGDFWELRAEYRKQALKNLRKREGLPTSERLVGAFYQRADGFYREPPGKEVFLDTTMYPNGNGGFTQWAKGTRKGLSREEAEKNWGRNSEFEILEVAEDGRKLEDEIRDLDRDAAGFDRTHPTDSPRVDLGQAGEQAPGLVVRDGAGDDEIDEVLQKFLKRRL
jgi:hypothetical protein